jgi:diguanylate cyclase (GGDEF)-like protein
MNRFLLAAIFLWCSLPACAAGPAPLASLHAIHSLSNAQADMAIPVAFETTITYYRNSDFDLFVQDGEEAVYVYYKQNAGLTPGDRVLVKGVTQGSFRPVVIADSVTLLHHGEPPKPVPASFQQLIRAELVCRRVTVRALVRSADLVWGDNNKRNIYLQLLMDGGYIDAAIDSDDPNGMKGLVDAQVEVTGVVAEKFDGKKQQVGVVIWAQTLRDLKIVTPARCDSDALPVTPMDLVLSNYRVQDLSRRVRVQGTITYYQPGSSIALQSGSKSLWIMTLEDAPMRVGDVADVTGFPDVRDGFLTLTHGEIHDLGMQAPILPRPVTWREVSAGSRQFDLISIAGTLVMQVRESSQDEYVLISDGNLVSAIYRHPNPAGINQLAPMENVPLGSKIRITGVSMAYNSDPFNGPLASGILLRGSGDIVVIGRPSWYSLETLARMVIVLLLVVLAIGAWGWWLTRKVNRQTTAMARRIEAEAAMERQRSRILEDINGSRPLAEILEEITGMVSLSLGGAPSWCEIAGGARLGNSPAQPNGLRLAHLKIPGRTGTPLGELFAGLPPLAPPDPGEWDALSVGIKLAALAIETRRLYTDLRHRSEFDLLTDTHNRFSLDRHMDTLIEEAREKGGSFGLIYMDLDGFKQVNDLYGHHVGDLYLKEVARRMKQQLRLGDLLARLGGDEFAALAPLVACRADAEEIAMRLERCLDTPFAVEGYNLRGSASVGIALYPEDGTTKDSLLSAADAAMYVAKHTRHSSDEPSEIHRKPGDRP